MLYFFFPKKSRKYELAVKSMIVQIVYASKRGALWMQSALASSRGR